MNLFKNLNFDKLKNGLTKTRDKLVTKINEAVTGRAEIDESVLEEIEEILITADIGFDVAAKIIDETRITLKGNYDKTQFNIISTVKNELIKMLDLFSTNNEIHADIEKFRPYVILIIGVNGVGKTTSIGKLAYNFKQAGLKVIIGAADTFRAAANEQLDIWAKRAGVEIIQKHSGADPSSVAFETVTAAIKNNTDVVIIDTAGRLHTKHNLMEELGKIKRVIKKVIDYAPNETLLVVDGNTGQNAIVQAEEFAKVTDLNGLIVTKLDGTAKGGVIFQICTKQNIPVKYIGVGESIDDLQDFDSKLFVDAIFNSY